MLFTLTLYVLKAALRDKVVLSFSVMFALATALSIFMGDAAVIEKNPFAIVFAAGSLRIIAVIGLVLFIITFIRRSHEARDIEFLLSRPVGKLQFILSYLSAFFILALGAAILLSVCLLIMAQGIDMQGYILWCASIVSELCIMATIAFFFSLALSSTTIAAFATFAFYVLARMMGQILGIIDHNSFLGVKAQIIEGAMLVISSLTPRLDLMGQSSWLLYGGEGGEISLLFIGMQGGGYVAFITLAILIDLWKKQF